TIHASAASLNSPFGMMRGRAGVVFRLQRHPRNRHARLQARLNQFKLGLRIETPTPPVAFEARHRA
ncbi:hypothetical protein, partial [Burkholderia ubonensis]|uniref:hypothetical protein n=1 Tax=Burkholderia ubonensis TaxID=101571 RepID=UPI001E51C513